MPIKARKKKISSGDKLVDWLFEMLMDVADKKVNELAFKKLINGKIEKIGKHYVGSGDLGRTYLGILDIGRNNDIEIEYRMSERSKGRVFMHELGHILFRRVREKDIRRLENRLWSRLCEDQKQALIKKLYQLRNKSRAN